MNTPVTLADWRAAYAAGARPATLLGALLARMAPDDPAWLARYPGIRVRSDASLAPGDCLVRSRFGLTDARQDAKLRALVNTLTGQ